MPACRACSPPALLAPANLLILGLMLLLVLRLTTSGAQSGSASDWIMVLAMWLAISAAIAAGALILRASRKIRLRHHVLLALVITAIPYPCTELFRHETLNLPTKVTAALWLSTSAAVPTGRKIAGAAYVLALLVDFLNAFGQMSAAYPGCTDLAKKLCA